jgi:hypothetical protein
MSSRSQKKRQRTRFDIEDGCPIPDTHRRLASAHRLWHQTTKLYPNPEGFRTNLNSTIQELRNVTFILQKEKQKIPNFDAWYAPHQARMKSDTLMKWLVEMRNRVVKQGDLETNSRAVARLVDAYFDRGADTVEVPPTASAAELATILAAQASPWFRHGYVEVERRWEVRELPERELLDALAECYSVLAVIVDDAHRAAGKPHETQTCPSVKNAPPVPPGGIPACMRVAREVRVSQVELGTLNQSRTRRWKVGRSEKAGREAAKRYGSTDEWSSALKTGNYETIARALHGLARAIIKKDPLGMAVHLFRGGRPVHFAMLMPTDKSDKYHLFREVAAVVDAFSADAVMMNLESWIWRRGQDGPREEAVLTVCERADGTGLALRSMFKRGESGIELGDAIEEADASPFNVLEPTRVVWRRRGLRP